MKISYVSNQVLPSNSAESIFVAKSCDSMQNYNNTVKIYCPNRKNFSINQDVKSFYALKNNLEIKKLPFFNIKGKYIIYHFMVFINILLNRPNLTYSRTALGAFVSLLLRIDTVVELHSLPNYNSLDGRVLRLISKMNHLKVIVCISNALKVDMKDVYSIHENKLIVEHDATDIRPCDNKQFTSEKKKLALGYVGSLYPGKGMEIISSLSKCLSKDKFEIDVYGGSKEEINSWSKHCTDLVNFKGHIAYSQIFEAIDSFDICLLPNQPIVRCAGYSNTKQSTDIGKYTSPMKMFDYMVSRKVILSSDLDILKEVLDEDSAYFAASDKPEQWIDILNLIYANQQKSYIKASNAYKKIIEYYNWDSRVSRILNEISKRY